MAKRIHVFLDVKGALTNWDDKLLASCVAHDDGSPMTAREAKAFLLEELAQGHELIPMAECDNFDWKKGCLGHQIPDEAAK